MYGAGCQMACVADWVVDFSEFCFLSPRYHGFGAIIRGVVFWDAFICCSTRLLELARDAQPGDTMTAIRPQITLEAL
jgi:hypothetical protein